METNARAFRVVPLSPEVAARARDARVDERGEPVLFRRDAERHQCRSCLSLTEPDEGHLLLSHMPFPAEQPYAERGPVFIHARDCAPYAHPGVYPPQFPRRQVVLRAYSPAHEIVGAELVGDRVVEDVIAQLLEEPSVSYLHARNATYGCLMFRIERP